MADGTTPADPLAELAFEIERFEWIGDDRLEVTGRWFGVRGLRFMRPTLHLRLGDRRRRLIALLDDKPWPPDGDGPWIAAFSWRGPHQGITAARLEVAPDVVLDLPAPGEHAAGTTLSPRPRPKPKPARKPTAPRRKPAPAADAPSAPPAESPPPRKADAPPPRNAGASPPPEADTPPAPAADARPSTADAAPVPPPDVATLALQRRLVEERAERERLADELRAAREQIAAQSAHHDSAVERSREVVRLEGELADAAREIERLKQQLADEVAPLPRRIPVRQGPQEWDTVTRAAAVAAAAVVLVVFALILATLL